MSYVSSVLISLTVGFIAGIYASKKNKHGGPQSVAKSRRRSVEEEPYATENTSNSTEFRLPAELGGGDCKMVTLFLTIEGASDGQRLGFGCKNRPSNDYRKNCRSVFPLQVLLLLNGTHSRPDVRKLLQRALN